MFKPNRIITCPDLKMLYINVGGNVNKLEAFNLVHFTVIDFLSSNNSLLGPLTAVIVMSLTSFIHDRSWL